MELILFCENRTIFTGANSFMDGSRACWAVIGSVSIGTIEDLVESSENANAMVVSFEKKKFLFAAVIQEIGQDKAKLVENGMIIGLLDSLGEEIEKPVLDRLSLDIKIVAFPKESETKVMDCVKIIEEFCHKLQSCFPSLRYSKIDFLRQVSVQSVSFLDIEENSFNRIKISKIIEEYIENKLSSDIDKTGDRFTRLLENKLNEMQIERHKQPVGPSTVSYENKRSGPVGLKQNVPSPSLYSNTGNNEKVLFNKFWGWFKKIGWFEKIEPMASIGVIIVFCITFLFFLFFYKNGSLAPERIKLLGDIDGWSWGERSSPIKIPWEANLTYLKQFIAKEGHAKVPLTFKTDDGNSLGRWVTNQRANHKNGSLAPERIKLLKDIKGWVWSAKK